MVKVFYFQKIAIFLLILKIATWPIQTPAVDTVWGSNFLAKKITATNLNAFYGRAKLMTIQK